MIDKVSEQLAGRLNRTGRLSVGWWARFPKIFHFNSRQVYIHVNLSLIFFLYSKVFFIYPLFTPIEYVADRLDGDCMVLFRKLTFQKFQFDRWKIYQWWKLKIHCSVEMHLFPLDFEFILETEIGFLLPIHLVLKVTGLQNTSIRWAWCHLKGEVCKCRH